MNRLSQIFVLFLAISSLLAPAPITCTSLSSPGHSCCTPDAQLTAPSCCQSDASTQSVLPAQVSDQAIGEFELSLLPTNLNLRPQQAFSKLRPSTPPPVQLPATILRT